MSSETLARPEEELTPIELADYIAGIESYLADAADENVLKPHQDEVFHDIQSFLQDGGKKGYVTAPTGTGKTVIFVELSKALMEAARTAGRKPRILVVEPTKDLVHQTLGRTGEKGYGKFAADLQVASYFSDSTTEDREYLTQSDVVVTTYDSLSLMTRRQEMRDRTDEEKEAELYSLVDKAMDSREPGRPEWTGQLQQLEYMIKHMGKVATGRKLIDFFDVIILDEAHHVLGDTAASIVDEIGDDKLVLGFTATPDANEKKRLDEHLPAKIHDLTFKEAISMELLAPIASVGLLSHTKVKGSDMFDKEGEYQEEKLAYLASATDRNRLITSAARSLVEHGFGTIIPCIPGQGARHAIMLADELQASGVSAAAVHGMMPSRERNRIYRRFEAGEIDVLTNIRILAEGWDSTRAKAIIEASPTRSLISKRQRVGRIVRPGDVAVVVDILDDYDKWNPPLHLADLLDGDELASGDVYGNVTGEQQQRVASLIKELGEFADLAEVIPADYSQAASALADYQEIVSGRVKSYKTGHYSVPEKISHLYKGLTDEIVSQLWQMKGKEPDVVLGRERYNLRMLFEVSEATQMLREIPESQKNRAYVIANTDERWLAAEGFVIGFQNKYPQLDVRLMEERLKELGDTVDWRPLKQPHSTDGGGSQEFEVFKAYKADKKTIDLLERQLQDYFEILRVEEDE